MFVEAKCGETISLNCSRDTEEEVDRFFWSDQEWLCNSSRSREERFHCSYTHPPHLVLTIQEVTPSDNGTYTCMLMATSGHGRNTTVLYVSGGIPRNSPVCRLRNVSPNNDLSVFYFAACDTEEPWYRSSNRAGAPDGNCKRLLALLLVVWWMILKSKI